MSRPVFLYMVGRTRPKAQRAKRATEAKERGGQRLPLLLSRLMARSEVPHLVSVISLQSNPPLTEAGTTLDP